MAADSIPAYQRLWLHLRPYHRLRYGLGEITLKNGKRTPNRINREVSWSPKIDAF